MVHDHYGEMETAERIQTPTLLGRTAATPGSAATIEMAPARGMPATEISDTQRKGEQGAPEPWTRCALRIWRRASAIEKAGITTTVLASLVSIAVPLATAFDLADGTPIRVASGIFFLITVPGVALIGSLRLPGALLGPCLALAFSLAANILVNVGCLVSGWWSPLGAEIVLGLMALAATPFALRRQFATAQATPAVKRSRSPDLIRQRLLTVAALEVALSLWWIQTQRLDLDNAGVFGVVALVGWPYVASVALIMVVIAYHLLRERLDHLMLTSAAVSLIVVLYGLVNVTDKNASVPTGWLHAGFIRYITDNGTIATGLDARFSWPGFFAAGAQLVTSTGVANADSFLLLAPVFYNIAAIPLLYLIGRSITQFERPTWFGIVIYLCSNWFQQDYFSPQGTVLLMYLAVLGTMLNLVARTPDGPQPDAPWFRRMINATRRTPPLPAGLSSRTSVAVELVLVVISAAIVVSHQLTPVALILTLSLFAVTGSTRYRSLWLVVSLLMVVWFSYGATDFWFGHLRDIFGDIGKVDNFASAVSNRIVGNSTYQWGQYTRIGLSGLLFLVALIGLLNLRIRLLFLVCSLMMSPFLLIALQSYGGEVVIRSFVYSSALLAPMAALAFRSHIVRKISLRRVVVIAVAFCLAAGMHTYTRGLNVSFERMPTSLLQASRFATDQLPGGGDVGVLSSVGAPPRDERVTEIHVIALDPSSCEDETLVCIDRLRPEIILITGTEDWLGRLQADLPAGWTNAIADELVRDRLYERIYQTRDAQVLRLVPNGG